MNKTVSIHSGLHALVWQEEDLFVAKAVEIEVASQGKTEKEAVKNLEEAISLYFEDDEKVYQLIQPLKSLKLKNLTSSVTYA